MRLSDFRSLGEPLSSEATRVSAALRLDKREGIAASGPPSARPAERLLASRRLRGLRHVQEVCDDRGRRTPD